MKIAGVSMVRNAADIIAVNLLHHLHSGADVVYVVDHASTDGTDVVLDRIAQSFPVKWLRFDGGFLQREVLTELARTAHRDGADWILPIDADEFWWSESGDLHRELAMCSAAAIECSVVHFIQRRSQVSRLPAGLLTMTRRVKQPIGSLSEVHQLVASKRAGFVEVAFPSKWISRASATLEILHGNHEIRGIVGRSAKSNAIQCLHAPLRAKAVFADRALHGAATARLESDPEIGWQSRHWRDVVENGTVDLEWAANSYDHDALDVYGTRKDVVVDLRLRDCAAKWIDHDLVKAPAREEREDREEHAGVAVAVQRRVRQDTELRARIAAAELRGTQQRLQSALSAVAARDALIADLSHSLPGRIYRSLAHIRFVRKLMRLLAGLR